MGRLAPAATLVGVPGERGARYAKGHRSVRCAARTVALCRGATAGRWAARARAALADAWARRRAVGDPAGASTTISTGATTRATTSISAPGPGGDDADLAAAAERVLAEALLTFGD